MLFVTGKILLHFFCHKQILSLLLKLLVFLNGLTLQSLGFSCRHITLKAMLYNCC